MTSPRRALVGPRGLLVLGALACALAAWLWRPVSGAGMFGAGVRVVLVDVSASVVRTRSEWAAWRDAALAEQARAATEADQELLVLCFAQGVQRWFGPDRASSFDAAKLERPQFRDGASELASALAAAREMLGSRHEGAEHVTLLGDGEYSGADPRDEFERWRAVGAVFELVRPEAPDRCDLALVSLRAPREIEAEAQLAMRAVVRSLGAPWPASAPAKLRLSIGGANGRVREQPLDPHQLAAGECSVRIDSGFRLPGASEIEVRIVANGDVAPENDARTAHVRIRGRPVVGVVMGDSLEAGMWGRVFQPAGQDIDFRQLRLEDLASQAPQLDVLVSIEIDPREFDAQLVREFVLRGGGWLAAGRESTLAGIRARTPGDLAELLPLRAREAPGRDVLLLLDGSGSMAGGALEQLREASAKLCALASPDDRIELVWFTDRIVERFELRTGVDADARAANAQRWMDARPPGGPTDVVGVLREIAEKRRGARPSLAFVVTDGRDQETRGADAASLDSLADELRESQVSWAVVAAGDDADYDFLEELAARTPRGSSALHLGDDFADALLEEWSRGMEWLENSPALVAPEPANADANFAELRDALRTDELPDAQRRWEAELRDGDEALLIAADSPWLAVRRAGAGFTATWTGPLNASERGKLFTFRLVGPLIRTLARGAPPQKHAVHARLAPDGSWEIAGCPPEWPPIVSVYGSLAPRFERSASVPHDFNAFDARRLRTGAAPAPDGELWTVRDGAGGTLAQLAAPLEHPAEFRAERPRAAWPDGAASAASRRSAGPPPLRRRLGLASLVVGAAAVVAAILVGRARPAQSASPSEGQVAGRSRR